MDSTEIEIDLTKAAEGNVNLNIETNSMEVDVATVNTILQWQIDNKIGLKTLINYIKTNKIQKKKKQIKFLNLVIKNFELAELAKITAYSQNLKQKHNKKTYKKNNHKKKSKI